MKMVGRQAYHYLTESITLQRLMRQQGDDLESIAFRTALSNLRQQEVTVADVDLLSTRVLSQLPIAEQRDFDDAVHILTKNTDVNHWNATALDRCNTPVVKIFAAHTGGAYARKTRLNDAGNLDAELYLAVGGKVMLTTNLWTAEGEKIISFRQYKKLMLDWLGLTNGVKGTIDSIFYPADATPNAPGNGHTANLPLAVLVHFPGYTGEPDSV